MNKPEISVIMTTYNRQVLLGVAIESILKQTYADFELLIIDDHSSDSTPEIVDGFARKDSRIRYFRLDRNLGCYGARNYGLKYSSGKYVAIADDDDVSKPNRLITLKRYFDNDPEASMAFSDVTLIRDAYKLNALWPNKSDYLDMKPDAFFKDLFLFGNNIPDPAVMFLKEPVIGLGGYPDLRIDNRRYYLWGDWILFMQLAANEHKFIYVKESLVDMNKRSCNSSMTAERKQLLMGNTESVLFIIKWLKIKNIKKYDGLRAKVLFGRIWMEIIRIGWSRRTLKALMEGLLILPSGISFLICSLASRMFSKGIYK